MNVHEYFFTSLTGASLPLGNYRGQPILIVNFSTTCEFTPQLRKLQLVWEDYRQSGLMVVGIPSNDFWRASEEEEQPPDEDAIGAFCESEYNITFPMTSIQSVMGRSANPLFVALREEYGEDSSPRWNFYKYLFDRQGQLLEFWPSAVDPDDPKVTHQIERNLHSWIL